MKNPHNEKRHEIQKINKYLFGSTPRNKPSIEGPKAPIRFADNITQPNAFPRSTEFLATRLFVEGQNNAFITPIEM